mmetsp:Transcript_21727/g.49482  ORF Transcript_21727/g.49482 Transcript_21727/m.49482 type:complete len:359 (-) Transcript_21727:200-1276(-)
MLVNAAKQILRRLQSQRNLFRIEDFHVVGTLQVLDDVPFPCRRKSLNGVHLTLLHLGRVVVLHDWDRLTCVDLVGSNRMAIEITDWLHWVRLPIDLNLVRLNRLLNSSANLREPCIDPGLFESSVCPILCRRNQIVVLRVESNGEGTVNNPAIHLNSKIKLAHIVMCQHYLIPIIRGVVRSHMIQGAAGGKSPATVQSVLLDEFQSLGLKLLANVDHRHSRTNVGLCKTSHLPVAFCCTPNILVVALHDLFSSSLLRIPLPVGIAAHILLLLTLRKIPGRIELPNRHGGRCGLLARQLRPIADAPQLAVILGRKSSATSALLLPALLLGFCALSALPITVNITRSRLLCLWAAANVLR